MAPTAEPPMAARCQTLPLQERTAQERSAATANSAALRYRRAGVGARLACSRFLRQLGDERHAGWSGNDPLMRRVNWRLKTSVQV
mmetsp:Transcript_8924/g.20849  ORF Transcript_8924/g.20849 Transcript_8924/m.20849 type:complete len:85 (+) Transcript_8924:705-959(+)